VNIITFSFSDPKTSNGRKEKFEEEEKLKPEEKKRKG